LRLLKAGEILADYGCAMFRSKLGLSAVLAVLFLWTSAASLPAVAGDCPHTLARGSAERQAIMDALRTPVTQALGQRVVFVVSDLNVCGDWAFFAGEPQRPNGRPVDWSIGSYADAVADDMCGGFIHALLVRQGGHWQIREQVICATDVPWVSWAQDFGAPAAIFPRF
jgi:hypothetical protein